MLITKGSTNVSVVVRIVDSSDGTPETGVAFNTAGIDMWYRREGAVSVDITEVTLAALTTAHADGGFLAINDGFYRLDLPDAALATGVDGVQIGGTVTGMVVHAPYIQLTDVDLFDAVRAGITALPNAVADAAGGLPISDAGGLDLDSLVGNIDAILVDTGTTLDTHLTDIKGATFNSSTDSVEAIRNRGDSAWTGSATTSNAGTAQAGSNSTITLESGASTINDTYNGQLIFISAGTGAGQSRAISSAIGYVGSTLVATIIGTWATNPDATSVYEITPADIDEIISPPSVADIADGVWDENTVGHTGAGTFGEQCANDIDAILADTGELQTDWANGGRLDALIDLILADTGELQSDDIPTALAALATASALATVDTVVDGIQTDLSNATDGLGAIKTVVDLGATASALAAVDTVVDAIQVVTDQFVFTIANLVDANTQAINDALVTGDGNATPWDGA